jgi:hypothetical protein
MDLRPRQLFAIRCVVLKLHPAGLVGAVGVGEICPFALARGDPLVRPLILKLHPTEVDGAVHRVARGGPAAVNLRRRVL